MLQAHYQPDITLTKDATLIQQQIRLLELQQPIDQADSETSQKAREIVQQLKVEQADPAKVQVSLQPEMKSFVLLPRPPTLVGLPLMTTLSYCCTYHFGKPASSFGSPEFFRKTFCFSEKQYVWVVLKAFARLKKWDKINQLLKTKSWFGKEKCKLDMDFKRIATILSQQGAEQRMVATYLEEICDIEDRLSAAIKIKCNIAAVDAFAKDRNREGLQEYAKKLSPDDSSYADLVLKNPTIKWKN